LDYGGIVRDIGEVVYSNLFEFKRDKGSSHWV
jgi:hypothetical protein